MNPCGLLWIICLVASSLSAQADIFEWPDLQATQLEYESSNVTDIPSTRASNLSVLGDKLALTAPDKTRNVQAKSIPFSSPADLKQTTTPAPSGRLIPASFFGMHIHRADSTTVWPNADFGSYRAWDANVSWANLEPSQGRWDFSRLDKLVSLATQHNVSVLITFGGTPAWASARPSEEGAYGKGSAAEPRDFRDWENYVRRVATRYRGRVKRYELANEPYFTELDAHREQRFFSGSVNTMVQMASSAKIILKGIDPKIVLLSPGFDNHADRLALFLKSGGGQHIDGVAVHLYTGDPKPEFMLGSLNAFKSVMLKYGIKDMPIICTEIGYDQEWIPKREMLLPFQDLLAAYIARAHALGAAAGLAGMYWYSWDGLGGGMAISDTGELNKVGTAYRQVIRWLKGVNIQDCQKADRSLWTCELNLGSRKARLVWDTEGSRKWTVSTAWHALQYETLDAHLLKLDSGATISIGPSPVLVQSDDKLWSVN